jgi:hypothetical protein
MNQRILGLRLLNERLDEATWCSFRLSGCDQLYLGRKCEDVPSSMGTMITLEDV